jgi:Domain of unknown function (DUF1707)
MSEPRPELRIGDRERDLIASVLQRALAEGRITIDELDARLDAALRGPGPSLIWTPGRCPLGRATLDRAYPYPARSEVSAGCGHGTSPNNRLVLDAGWSSVTRSGRWDIRPSWCSTERRAPSSWTACKQLH